MGWVVALIVACPVATLDAGSGGITVNENVIDGIW